MDNKKSSTDEFLIETLGDAIQLVSQTELIKNESFINFLKKEGYYNIKHVPGWGICAISRFAFTFGVVHGIDIMGRKGRFCFESMADALAFYDTWDGSETPIVGKGGCTAIK